MMIMAEDLQPRKSIRNFPLGDEMLLFDENSGQLYCINATAGAIWKGCRAGLSREAIIEALWDATGVKIERIAKDVDRALTQWHAMGLLHTSQYAARGDRQQALPVVAREFAILEAEIDFRPGTITEGCQGFFKILDTCFHLRVPTRMEWECVMPLFAHLPSPAQAACQAEFNIVHTDNYYALLHNGSLLDWCEELAGIAPMVNGNSLLIAYELSQCLFGLHAAAVVGNNQSILMPAISGSGKSTLTAALVGSGYQYCADDLVLLTPAPIRMQPVPAAVGLKSGSWSLLEAYHECIAGLRTHIRVDGKHIRYLVPPAQALQFSEAAPLPVNFIVFPQYDANTRGSVLTKINPADGLCRMTAAGYDLHGSLTADIVARMVEWISDIPCHELRFSRLDEAVSTLHALIES